ncbi:MAG TPA: penicillin-binding protein [Candidatus Lachnoclostridium pullistercoris]|uniref:Penicillin-binding protein n=1 Tax=Candidatus Lachnoclostridium pullistercoris TaxID=2838632 RepID=A0A9D2PDQ8_9FIRM|nr:penicillin-binding protein [Candidatus Lachnoclostridium pullistercoris]
MFDDFLELIKTLGRKILSSRLAALAIVFSCMFVVLVVKLFNLQIVNGESYLRDYIQLTEREVTTPGTRGNIYDRNGNVLAYNKLAYTVTVQDNGEYADVNDRNAMLLRLVRILNKHGEKVEGRFEVAIDDSGEMYYTSSTETARRRFLSDLYGLRTIDELTGPDGDYPADITARELFENRMKTYELDELTDENGNPISMTDEEALQVVNIRYTMGLTSYRRYEATQVTSYISEETMADITEHSADLLGVDVTETTIRVYNDSVYFAPIIGYTGKVQEDQLEQLQKEDPDYALTDIVGRTGIESAMETFLQGKKGHQTISVDNVGRVMEVLSQTDPVAGEDVYLTIDRDLQKGIYHLIEQQLAGIVASKLVNEDESVNEDRDGTSRVIPIRDAYFQLINNNVLSADHFAAEDASSTETGIYRKYSSAKSQIFDRLRAELYSDHPTAMKDLPEDLADYMSYISTYLASDRCGILVTANIDQGNEQYQAWKNQTISLREYLYAGIAGSWIDTSRLEIDSKYSGADDIYEVLVETALSGIEEDSGFEKKIYDHLIHSGTITGKELCLALYDQGVLADDPSETAMLQANGEEYAFQFIRNKISNIELTPAQMALEPCTAGVTVTDVNTGEVLALVTYPSYDNNRLSGTMDTAYYNQLLNDLSNPLYNNATQVVKAPGSTFKPITAIAALEEGVGNAGELINCTGLYEEVATPIRCSVYPGSHGEETMVEAIQNSCNYYFNEMGHRLSIDENGTYSSALGVEKIREYAAKFGLDSTSGVEIPEVAPHMTTEDPERSAMGQATHAYNNVQLSRYVTAIANRGTVYNLSLIDKVTDSDGNLIEDYTPEVYSTIDVADSSWDTVQAGMRRVITNTSLKRVYGDMEVAVAGKTGTAQETSSHANHAFFISYAPFENPEISVTVNIPNGYTSANAASLAKNVYQFYFGYTDLDQIMNTKALEATTVNVRD